MENNIEKFDEANIPENEIEKKYIIREQIKFFDSEDLIDKEKNKDFICPICFFVLNNPISCSDKNNSHSFCKECIDNFLQDNDKCPTCKLKFEYKIKDEIYNSLNELLFKCKFENEGCDKILFYYEYLDHINNCKYSNLLYECNIKKYNYEKKIFEKCGYLGNKIEIQKHLKSCAFKQNKCIFVMKIF